MTPTKRWLIALSALLLGIPLMVLAIAAIVLLLAYPQLPDLNAITDYHPKIPLRVFTSDGALIGEFGDERRSVVPIGEVPVTLKKAILAAEDEHFYEHSGIDYTGVVRAAWANLVTGGKRQGASTITMQVARNFFLSREKTLSRKVYEALLAFKIENNLSKDEILTLYINQIYLGERAYGFASAAQTYFGKNLKDLSVAESAMLAGLPKAPSLYNPVVNPQRAKLRQQYVLRRMHETGGITDVQFQAALKETLHVSLNNRSMSLPAAYVSEMARQLAVEQYGDAAYTSGLKVVTTISRADQEAAYQALRQGVLDYDRRHPYRGAEAYVDMSDIAGDDDEGLEDLAQDHPDAGELRTGLVLEADATKVKAYLRGGVVVTVTGDNLRFAKAMLEEKAPANRRLRRGAVIRLMQLKSNWQIVQLPEVEAALVSLDPQTGAIKALVGGFDFNRNKFNHVTQAWRQPGSSFKPFIYSAALEKGFSPSSVIDDSPFSVSAEQTGGQAWEPKNYDGKYDGPITMRTALAKSKNMVSIRILMGIGTRYAQDYASRFGFDPEKHPPYLTMALGAGSATPWQMASAYAVFANGGFRIQPYVVKEITDENGRVLAKFSPTPAGDPSRRIIDPRNAYLMNTMLQDVVRYGTAAKAMSLKRSDLAGKTGTTNDYVDAWFCGYQPKLVTITWMGFDQPRKLGSGETGGAAALPIWINYMGQALKGIPEAQLVVPDGLVAIEARAGGEAQGRGDLMYKENVPQPEPVINMEAPFTQHERGAPTPALPPVQAVPQRP